MGLIFFLEHAVACISLSRKDFKTYNLATHKLPSLTLLELQPTITWYKDLQLEVGTR